MSPAAYYADGLHEVSPTNVDSDGQLSAAAYALPAVCPLTARRVCVVVVTVRRKICF